MRLELVKKDDIKNIIKQQSKITFNGIHESYENIIVTHSKKNEVVMDKAIYVGFDILELSKLHMYETYFDKYNQILGKKFYIYTIPTPME